MSERLCPRCRSLLKKAAVICAVCGALAAGTMQPGAAPTHASHAGAPLFTAIYPDLPEAPHYPYPEAGDPLPGVDASTTVATTRAEPLLYRYGGTAPTM